MLEVVFNAVEVGGTRGAALPLVDANADDDVSGL